MNVDFFMKEAIIEADKAYNLNEIPVGGILVDNTTNKIVARSYNSVNKDKNAIKHCELNLIQETCERLKLKYLENMTLFVTLEPCTMCAAALVQARIGQVIYGAEDNKRGGFGGTIDLSKHDSAHHKMIITKGILAQNCKNKIKIWFKKMRSQK